MKNSGLVYSTEHGRMCPECSKPVKQCICRTQQAATAPTDGIVRVSRETKGRKGKGVTLVTGVPMSGEELKEFAKTLKARCGSGGTIKEGNVIEVQGDHRDLVVEVLKQWGWTVKRAGG